MLLFLNVVLSENKRGVSEIVISIKKSNYSPHIAINK